MAKPDTTDEAIIAAVKTRFESITAGADYYTTFDKVFDNHPGGHAAISKNNNKIINLRDSAEDFLQTDAGEFYHDVEMQLEIDIIAKGSSAADIRKMKADILKSIGTDIEWSGLAFYTHYVGSVRNKTDQMGNLVADITITIGIQFRRNAWGK